MAKFVDVQGQKFGKLVVVEKDKNTNGHENYWTCRCECGGVCSVRISHLRAGTVWRCHNCKCASMRNEKLCGEITTQFWKRLLKNASLKKRGVSFTPEEAWNIFNEQNGCCAYSGVRLEFSESSSHTVRNQTTASIDRIDSNKPYVLGNIQWVHKVVNKMKMDLEPTEFLDWCKKIAKEG